MTRSHGALRIEGLTVEYRHTTRKHAVTAVRDASLEVPRGSVVGLVGESGSGKSSIARAIVGLAPRRAGSVYMDDRVLQQRDRAARRSVQMVFQNPRSSLDPRRTIQQTLVEALAVTGAAARSEWNARSIEVLDAVSLGPEVLPRLPHQLSGGQCQRVAIARALAARPRFLIADEATAALDASVGAGVVRLLRQLAVEHGLGVLLITHDLRTVEQIADGIAVMYLGRIVESGPAAEVLAAPRHPYTAALLAARPSLEHRRTRALPLRAEGELPQGGGCAFAPRCPVAAAPCAVHPTTVSDGGRAVACHVPLVGQPADLD